MLTLSFPRFMVENALPCRRDPALFDRYEPGEETLTNFTHRYHAAVGLCHQCPVKQKCEDWSTTIYLPGITGGQYHGHLSPTVKKRIELDG